jgi:hypothetical protein
VERRRRLHAGPQPRHRREPYDTEAAACVRLFRRGFLLAPGVGEVLADLVTAGETATPLSAFSIGRFFREAAPSAPIRQQETQR